MTMKLTRRSFGLLGVTTAAAAMLRGVAPVHAATYANPELLWEPMELLGRMSPIEPLVPLFDAHGFVLIDVREREAYDAAHIPGARHLNPNAVVALHSPVDGALRSMSEIEALLGDLGIAADRQVVLYDDRGGFHAARMFWLLEYMGHRQVAILNGGLTGWMEMNGPLARDGRELVGEPALFQAAPSPRRFASADDVLAMQDDVNAVLIDVRPSSMYQEAHIPWAQNVPWAMNLDDDGRFLSADALLAHFESFGVIPDHSVTLHCQVGLASSHSYVALRLLGYPRVRVYHRSWAEWGNDPSLPKIVS